MWKDLARWSFIISIAAVLAWGGYAFQAIGRNLDFRCERHPASVTYRRYLHAIPSGVSDIRAAGYSNVGGADVWMRFSADAQAINELTREWTRMADADAAAAAKDLSRTAVTEGLNEYEGEGVEHRVHWYDLRKAKNPEVYQYRRRDDGNLSTLVVDRRRHRVFFYHWSI